MLPSPSRSSVRSSSTRPSRSSSMGMRRLRLLSGLLAIGHEVIAAVDVDDRHDVEADLVDEGRDLGVLAVAAEEVIEKVERDVAALDLVAVHVAVDVEGRLVEGGAGLGIVDGHGHERPAFLALADRLERRQLGIGLGEGPERFVDLVERVVLVEPQRDRHLGFLRRQGRSEEQDQQRGTGELFHLAPPRSTVRESPQAFWVSALISSLTGFAARTIQVTGCEPRAGTDWNEAPLLALHDVEALAVERDDDRERRAGCARPWPSDTAGRPCSRPRP